MSQDKRIPNFPSFSEGNHIFVEDLICEWLFRVKMDGISVLFLSVSKQDWSPLHGDKTSSTLCASSLPQSSAHQQTQEIITSFTNCQTRPQGRVYLSCVFELQAQGSVGFGVQSLFPALPLPGSNPQQSCTSSLICTREIAVSVSQGVLRSLVH